MKPIYDDRTTVPRKRRDHDRTFTKHPSVAVSPFLSPPRLNCFLWNCRYIAFLLNSVSPNLNKSACNRKCNCSCQQNWLCSRSNSLASSNFWKLKDIHLFTGSILKGIHIHRDLIEFKYICDSSVSPILICGETELS